MPGKNYQEIINTINQLQTGSNKPPQSIQTKYREFRAKASNAIRRVVGMGPHIPNRDK